MTSPFRSALDIAASIAMLTCSGVMLWLFVFKPATDGTGEPIVPLPKSPIAVSRASTRGGENAQLAVIEFSDFQCPFCGRFARITLPTLLRDYVDTGKVRYSFKHLPVAALHPEAESAAMAAECAGQQDKFWEMHDVLFNNQTRLEAVFRLEKDIGLDLDESRFAACMSGPRDAVSQAISLAKALGISATPTFLVGSVLPDGQVMVSKIITGVRPTTDFDKILGGWLRKPSG